MNKKKRSKKKVKEYFLKVMCTTPLEPTHKFTQKKSSLKILG